MRYRLTEDWQRATSVALKRKEVLPPVANREICQKREHKQCACPADYTSGGASGFMLRGDQGMEWALPGTYRVVREDSP